MTLEPPPIDLRVLADAVGDDDEVQQEIVRDFEAVLVDARGALARALPHDLPEAARIAHRAKGSARQVGAKALASALQALEDAARDQRAELSRNALAQVEAEAGHCAAWLQAQRRRLA
jgi:HPt (histidine-containing phosphotransfer) domain-containing protein